MQERKAVLVFIDGLGLSASGDANPWSQACTPFLRSLLGGSLCLENVGAHPGAMLSKLDATLGVPGIPQSASGQTALLTGVNAPAQLGRHLSGYPNDQLNAILSEHSIFRRLLAAGKRATFANAYYDSYWEQHSSAPHSATTMAVLTAGLPFFNEEDLRQGRAVYQDITNELLVKRGLDLPIISPELAGKRLASIAQQFDFTLFEFFQTDISAHKQDRALLYQHIQNLDLLLGSLTANMDLSSTLMVVASDHGNSEDLTSPLHSTNPVPGLIIGSNTELARGWQSIMDITPAICRWLCA